MVWTPPRTRLVGSPPVVVLWAGTGNSPDEAACLCRKAGFLPVAGSIPPLSSEQWQGIDWCVCVCRRIRYDGSPRELIIPVTFRRADAFLWVERSLR